MQSETRWSCPPSDPMLTSAHLDVMAKAILCGEQERDAVAARLVHVLGRNWRWIRPLAGRYLETFGGQVRPRRREVVSFLRVDPGLVEAWHKYRHQIKILHWITGPQSMQPVAVAETWPVARIETLRALAEWLELTPSELQWFADLKGLGYKRPQPRLEHYHYRVLAKASGGIRLIESPKDHLKGLQRRILSGILDRIPSHPAAHGFVHGRSIQTFAAPHVGYPEQVADLLGGITTNSVPRNAWRDVIRQPGFALAPQELWHLRDMYSRPHLPQGAPTSPSLANFCSYRLDGRLSGLARSGGAVYTRYADDLAFSGGDSFDHSVERFSTLVAVILMEEGFAVQHRKTRIMRRSVRQHLAGLVTNQRLNVRRSDLDLLKAILTNCIRHRPETQNREGHPHFRQHLEGRISFVESIHPEKGRRLRAIFEKIEWE
jgi:RNA-directed DNA polymerase